MWTDNLKKYKIGFRLIICSILFVLFSILIIYSNKYDIYKVSIYLVVQVTCVVICFISYKEQIKRITLDHNDKLKWFASIYPGVAAVWLIFFKDEIYRNTRDFIALIKSKQIQNDLFEVLAGHDSKLSTLYSVDVNTVYYLLIIFIWLFVYFYFVTNESFKNESKNKKLESTILRAPNPQVFRQHFIIIKKISKIFSVMKNPSRHTYHQTFQIFLEELCELTKIFMNKISSDDGIYGANIMLYIDTNSHKHLVEYLRANGNCYHFVGADVSSVAGVLRLVPGLIFSNHFDDGTNRTIPSITLPVMRGGTVKEFYKENLPGAPISVYSGEYIMNDVFESDHYKDLKFSEREKALAYWQSNAKDVKSVVSIRIPFNGERSISNGFKVIGVINIDSSTTFPLGTENEFHPTYWSLVLPLMQLIEPHLRNYHDMYIADLQAVVDNPEAALDI